MKDILLFQNKIMNATTIAIMGHVRPDGDCIGSCLGLYNYLIENYPDKEINVYLEEVAAKFAFLPGADKVITSASDKIYDLAISLDCGDTDRHGKFGPIFDTAKDTIALDHHRSNLGFGNYFYCDPDASSASEVLYNHFEADKVSLNCATCLYLGIVHDTGVFKYSCTSESTMKIAGSLLAKGVNSQSIIDDTFYKVTFKQNKLSGEALLRAKLYLNDKVIVTCVDKELFDKYNATKADTDGIVDKIRVTEGVEVAIFAYQLSDTSYKFSLRSVSYVDVSKISVAFGGGGHMRAAGFEAKGDYEESLHKILHMIEEQI